MSMNCLNQTETAGFTLKLHCLLPEDYVTRIYSTDTIIYRRRRREVKYSYYCICSKWKCVLSSFKTVVNTIERNDEKGHLHNYCHCSRCVLHAFQMRLRFSFYGGKMTKYRFTVPRQYSHLPLSNCLFVSVCHLCFCNHLHSGCFLVLVLCCSGSCFVR